MGVDGGESEVQTNKKNMDGQSGETDSTGVLYSSCERRETIPYSKMRVVTSEDTQGSKRRHMDSAEKVRKKEKKKWVEARTEGRGPQMEKRENKRKENNKRIFGQEDESMEDTKNNSKHEEQEDKCLQVILVSFVHGERGTLRTNYMKISSSLADRVP